MRGGTLRSGSRSANAALAAAALAWALPGLVRALDTVPLPAMLPSPEPGDDRRLWLGARAHGDCERFEITLSDGTRYARARPSGRLAGEVGLRLGPRASASLVLTGAALGAVVQLDVVETGAAKLAFVVQADLNIGAPQGNAGAGAAASAAVAIGGVRLVPFARLDAHVASVYLGRHASDGGAYGGVSRWETAIVPAAGVALPLRRVEIAVAGGWRAVVGAGGFDEVRPADPLRRDGAYAIVSARWVIPLRREGG